MSENEQLRVCVVGAGKRFLGGISYYTLHLINALAQNYDVSAILMRQLLPTRLYPGWKRVGTRFTELRYSPQARVFDGVDWYWLPSIVRALLFLKRERPRIIIFQWWSGTVLHSYLLLALVAQLLQAKIIIEFHEVLDPGEASLPFIRAYVQLLAPLMVHMAHAFIVHSEYDRKLLRNHYRLGQRPDMLIRHGPYNHYQLSSDEQNQQILSHSYCNLLFFGLIRPYKGLDDLIRAFDALPESEVENLWLTIVGETWEGCTTPSYLIKRSRYRHRITFVNRYVSDTEAAEFFAGADAVIFPYHRSSSSGPLHIAMSCGLPVVVTQVGGLMEAIAGYEGAIVIPPEDSVALQNALLQVAKLRGKRYEDTHSWERTVVDYQTLFKTLMCCPTVMNVPFVDPRLIDGVGLKRPHR